MTFDINWPSTIVAIVGATMFTFLFTSLIAALRNRRWLSWGADNDLIIRNTNASVTIVEPATDTEVGDEVVIRGTQTDRRGRPSDRSDVVILVRTPGTDEWNPSSDEIVRPQSDGAWEAEVTLPPTSRTIEKVELMAFGLPPTRAAEVRSNKPIRFRTQFPRSKREIARHVLYHAPASAHIVSKSVVRRTDWENPVVKKFLERSNMNLPAIDTALAAWVCPTIRQDWGWRSDREIDFNTDDKRLVDPELPEELSEIVHGYKAGLGDFTDSVRYCLTEYLGDPRDARGRLELTVRPITFFGTYPIMKRLMEPESEFDREIRRKWFNALTDREIPLRPNTLDMQVLVVSGDDQLMFARRRKDRGLHFMRGRWSATMEEQFNADWKPHLPKEKVYKSAHIPDLSVFSALNRALKEEIGLEPEEIQNSTRRVLAAGFEYDSFGTSIYGMAELPSELTAERIARSAVTRPEMLEEHDTVAWCPFHPRNLRPTLLRSESPVDLEIVGEAVSMEGNWHPSSRLRIALGLRRRFGSRELERWLEF